MKAALFILLVSAFGLTACGSEDTPGCNIQPFTSANENAPIQQDSCTIVQLPVGGGAVGNGNDGGTDKVCLRPPCD